MRVASGDQRPLSWLGEKRKDVDPSEQWRTWACRVNGGRVLANDSDMRLWCSPVPAPQRTPGQAPGEHAAGGGSRPGARGPGRGPTVVWAQPGCLGAFSCRAPPRSQLEIGWLLTFL